MRNKIFFGLAGYLIIGYLCGLWMRPDLFSTSIPNTHWDNVFVYFWLLLWQLGLLLHFLYYLIFVAIFIVICVVICVGIYMFFPASWTRRYNVWRVNRMRDRIKRRMEIKRDAQRGR